MNENTTTLSAALLTYTLDCFAFGRLPLYMEWFSTASISYYVDWKIKIEMYFCMETHT